MIPIAAASLPLTGTRSYGFQRSPTHTHNGIDLPAPLATSVRAAAAGEVAHASSVYSPGFSGYGAHVVVAHPDGTHALYAHLASVSVTRGDAVREGDVIGAVGNTRFTREHKTATFAHGGYHLHFEVSPTPYPQPSDAPRLDPVAWLRARGDVPGAPADPDLYAALLADAERRLATERDGGTFLALGLVALGLRWLTLR